MPITTILFDMDGVVIDSEKLHLRALGLTLKQNNINFPEEILNDFVGRSDTAFFIYVKEKLNNRIFVEEFIQQKNTLYFGLLSELQFVNGFMDFIKEIKAKQIHTALVTSSSLFSVEKADKRLNFTHFFDVIITEESTTEHKPEPAPYLLALENTKANPASTIVIEDSINGIQAGKASECIVCGLTTSFSAETLKNAGADFAFESYTEIADQFFTSF